MVGGDFQQQRLHQPALDHLGSVILVAWLGAMRKHSVFTADARRTAVFMKSLKNTTHERHRLFWSGERIEWLMAGGFHRWFLDEIESGRAAFPQ